MKLSAYKISLTILLLTGVLVISPALTFANVVPRTIVVLYDSVPFPEPVEHIVHRHAQMPLNHLGLVLEYHDINVPLPAIANRTDVRGILTWASASEVPNPERYLEWLETALDAGKRLVSIGPILGLEDRAGREADPEWVNRVLTKVGFRLVDRTHNPALRPSITHLDPRLIGFERLLSAPLPRFAITRAIATKNVFLSVRGDDAPASESDLVVIGPRGGFVARHFALYLGNAENHRQWIINPFEFFRLAFATDDPPKPDTTTVSARRIYYSHIDGDGWRNVSLVDEYQATRALSSKVILEEAIRPFADLPVTVAPITADLSLDWYGTPESRRVASELFALPQVEIGTHTHTHPFFWQFFENYRPEQERALLPRYEKLHGNTDDAKNAWAGYGKQSAGQGKEHAAALRGYHVPRAYGRKPFDLESEVKGSIAILAELAPPGKRVEVLQWSGNTEPFEAAVAATIEAGVQNINGGDSRFDAKFPSYAYVAPVGRQVGRYRQIYASNSNENTYTNLWRGPYFGFKNVRQTFERTESPMRLRAANVYYHMYSGERPAALKALIANLDWVRRNELAPIATSHYAAIGQGFFSNPVTCDWNAAVASRGARCAQHHTIRPRRGSQCGLAPIPGHRWHALPAPAGQPLRALGCGGERSHRGFKAEGRHCITSTARLFGSSEKSVGELRLGKFAKCVIKRKFQDPKGAETVRFSHRDFGFVVEALDDAARVDFSRPEIVQEQLAVAAQGARELLHRLDARAHHLATPLIEELARPER